MALRRTRLIPALLSAAAAFAPAQSVISTQSGLVYSVRGRVSVEGSGSLPMGGKLRQLKSGEILAAERGRAEVLLNPAAVLRLGNMTRVRMDDVQLSDPCLTLLSGSAVISIIQLAKGRMPKDDHIEIHLAGGIVVLTHPGEYRFDADPNAGLRVFDGRAEVLGAATPVFLRRGKSIGFEHFEVMKFNARSMDTLERWARASSEPARPRGELRPIPPYIGFGVSNQRSQDQAPQQPGGFTNSAAPRPAQ